MRRVRTDPASTCSTRRDHGPVPEGIRMAHLNRRRFVQLSGTAGAAAVLADPTAYALAAPGAPGADASTGTTTAKVELRQGTNVSAAVSPDGGRLIVEV